MKLKVYQPATPSPEPDVVVVKPPSPQVTPPVTQAVNCRFYSMKLKLLPIMNQNHKVIATTCLRNCPWGMSHPTRLSKAIHATKAKVVGKKLSDHFPCIEVIHTLDDADCHCDHCLSQLEVMSQKASEQIELIPMTVKAACVEDIEVLLPFKPEVEFEQAA